MQPEEMPYFVGTVAAIFFKILVILQSAFGTHQ